MIVLETRKTDLLIIGAGPGGYVSAIYAAKKGLDVTLIEKRFLGGTCLNVGCIPTKSLVKSADVFTEAKEGEKYGVVAKEVTIDLENAVARKDFVVKNLTDGIGVLLEKNGVKVINGTASFLDDSRVLVKSEDTETVFSAKDIIIATGSKTKHLPINIETPEIYLDSEGLLKNTKLPETMTVIGGGIIGMEFAFAYGRCGVKVEVIEFLPSILPMVDRDLSMRLLRYAKMSNIHITTSAKVTEVKKSESGKALVCFETNGEMRSVEADLVLEAVGRGPETNMLGLENTSIKIGKRGEITVDDRMKTSVESIYAIGDVNNKMQLAHVASHQGMIAVENILGKDAKMDYTHVPSVIFTSPQIATIGKSEAELQAEGTEYRVVRVPYSANGKALISDSQAGFIKLLAKSEGNELYGAQIFGNDAEHLIASLDVAMTNNLSVEDIKKTIFAHPTISEIIHEAYLGLAKEAIHFLN